MGLVQWVQEATINSVAEGVERFLQLTIGRPQVLCEIARQVPTVSL
jgi:hypothetical protein